MVASTTVNLTAVGLIDWAQWSGNVTPGIATDFMSGAGHTIPDPSVRTSGTFQLYTDPRTVSWTNGTNAPTSSVAGAIYNNGAATGCGFQLVLPADTLVRTVNVYIGGFSLTTAATVVATLSDASAGPITNNTSFTGPASTSVDGLIQLVYAAGSAAQTLTLQWYQTNGTGNVGLQAVAIVSAAAGAVGATVAWVT